MSQTGKVIDFVGQVLEREGALIERPEPGRLETILTPDLRGALELDELAVLVEADEDEVASGEIPCGHGTEVLAKTARLALGSSGRVAFGEASGFVPTSREPKAYQGLNLTYRVVQVSPVPHWILVGIGRYEATSDDQREGLVRAAISAAQGTPVELPNLESLRIDPLEREDLPDELIRSGFAELHRVIMAETVERIAEFREAVARRHRRDAQRVDRYFTEVAEDLRGRIGNRRDVPGLRAKLEALPAERKRRRAQLALNHAIQVKVELVGLAAIRGPALKAELEVRRRKNQVTLNVYFDGLSNEWVPLRCDGCGQPTFLFAMCDEARHVLCSDCWDEAGTGGHRDCFRCEGKPMRPRWRRGIKAAPKPAAPTQPKPKQPAEASAKPAEPPPPSTKPAASSRGPKPKRRSKKKPPSSKGATANPPLPKPPKVASVQNAKAPTPAEKRKRKLQGDLLGVLIGLGRPSTSTEIREKLPISADKLRNLLAPLIDEGLVGKVGQRRGTRYFWAGKKTSQK